jgi:hypothetical protein
VNARTAVEACDLEARVLAEHPRICRPHAPAERRLRVRVFVVRLAVLRWILVGVEKLELPSREQPRQLASLVLVSRAETSLQSF